MKRSLQYLLAIFCSVALFNACSDSGGNSVEPVDISLNVNMGEGYEDVPASDASVKLTNTNTAEEYTSTSNAAGEVVFTEIPAGTYDVAATLTISADTYLEVFGVIAETAEVTLNGTLANVQISELNTEFTLSLVTGKIGDLVIKQIYFTGSHTRNGAMFRDHFIEIYNNSNEVIYADGLMFAGLMGTTKANEGQAYNLPNGQYDWAQSIGMPSDINANEDYVYAKYVYEIPGSGQDNPIQPGTSIVIAGTAINHKAPYIDADEDTVTVADPSLTVDLSGADFEGYLGDTIAKPLDTDLDNPAVPNLIPRLIYGRELLLNPQGRESFIIFRVDAGYESLNAYPTPKETAVTEDTDMYAQIPTSFIIDGVQIQRSPTNQLPPQLQLTVDAGYTYAPNGSYSSQSVIRKTAKVVDGRVVLKDTNNSTEDFGNLDVALPGEFIQ